MKQEDKELLLRDLCARLPYGVNVLFNNSHIFTLHQINPNESTRKDGYGVIFDFGRTYSVNDCKPYLCPMSSMTEEEEEEYEKVIRGSFERQLEFYLRKHLDFRGLIPKGLALPAPEDMYNF